MHIPIMNIFRESFAEFKANKISWARLAFAPFVLYFIGYLIVIAINTSMGIPIHPQKMPTDFWPIFGQVFNFILSIIAGLCLYINGYRYALLSEGGNSWWQLNIDKRLGRLLLYTLLIIAIALVPVIFGVALVFLMHMAFNSIEIDVSAGILVGIFLFYILLRLSLIYPLVSIDHPTPVSTSWRMLKGNVLRLLGLLLLIGLKIIGIFLLGFIIIGVIGTLFFFISPMLAFIPIVAAVAFLVYLWILNWAVVTKSLSLVYQTFTQGEI